MKVRLVQIFYFLLFFSVLVQEAMSATGGGNVGTWYGYVKVNDTIVASDNTTVVSAYINSTSTPGGNTTVGAAYCELSNCTGFYYIDVQANEGENITFKICGVNASQGQQTFSAGPHSLLNLSINKSTNGATCTFACGCLGGYCVHDYCRSSSTYCGDGYCDTGESCSSDNSACSSGYACTNGCVATGGGGGVGSIVTSCIYNWTCTEWSSCINGIQTRVCSNLGSCKDLKGKPLEHQTCKATPPASTKKPTEPSIPKVTPVAPSVTTSPTTPLGLGVGLLAVIIVSLIFTIIILRKRKLSKNMLRLQTK
jgi:hypothetical protein